jgi:hypothetical protein
MGRSVNVTCEDNQPIWEAKLTAHRAPSIMAVSRDNGGAEIRPCAVKVS